MLHCYLTANGSSSAGGGTKTLQNRRELKNRRRLKRSRSKASRVSSSPKKYSLVGAGRIAGQRFERRRFFSFRHKTAATYVARLSQKRTGDQQAAAARFPSVSCAVNAEWGGCVSLGVLLTLSLNCTLPLNGVRRYGVCVCVRLCCEWPTKTIKKINVYKFLFL